MRGGAIPIYAWGLLLAALFALNWIWTGDAIQIGEFGFAVAVILGAASLLVIRSRQAVRRGPPGPEAEPEVLPDASLASVTAAIGLASILFGFVWSIFLVLFGAGLLIASLARVALELRAERASRRAVGPEARR